MSFCHAELFAFGKVTKSSPFKRKVEESDFGIAGQLAAGDLFFLDSTHTLGPAGQVSRIILRTAPAPAGGSLGPLLRHSVPLRLPSAAVAGLVVFAFL